MTYVQEDADDDNIEQTYVWPVTTKLMNVRMLIRKFNVHMDIQNN